MLVGEYMAVDELFHLLYIRSGAHKSVDGGVFPMSQDTEEQVVRRDAVTAGSHGFFTRVVDDGIQLV